MFSVDVTHVGHLRIRRPRDKAEHEQPVCIHHVAWWAVFIASTDISDRDATATRLPNGDQRAPRIVGGRDPPPFQPKSR